MEPVSHSDAAPPSVSISCSLRAVPIFTSSFPGRGVKYCDEYVCLSVCLSGCISQKLCIRTSPNFLHILTLVMPWSSSGGVSTCYILLFGGWHHVFTALYHIMICIAKQQEWNSLNYCISSCQILLNDKRWIVVLVHMVGCYLHLFALLSKKIKKADTVFAAKLWSVGTFCSKSRYRQQRQLLAVDWFCSTWTSWQSCGVSWTLFSRTATCSVKCWLNRVQDRNRLMTGPWCRSLIDRCTRLLVHLTNLLLVAFHVSWLLLVPLEIINTWTAIVCLDLMIQISK